MRSFFSSQPSHKTMADTTKEVGKFALGIMTIATAYLALQHGAANDEVSETSREENSSSFLDCLIETLMEFGEENDHSYRYNDHDRNELLRTLP